MTDYFAPTQEEEVLYRGEYLRLKAENGICDNGFYHYDTPLTPEHEMQALAAAGFRDIQTLKSWGATHTLRAVK